MLSARDTREFRGFLRNATDRQVQGIYDKEKRAGRDDYAELAIEEARTRGIFLDRATMKKARRRPERPLTEENVAALQARGREAAAAGMSGIDLDRQLKAEGFPRNEHTVVRLAFNDALETIIDANYGKHGHSTKKSPAQLDREIAEALGKRRGGSRAPRSHATVKSGVPGIAKWNMTAGGTSAAPGKHGYSYRPDKGEYHIWPYTTKLGRHAGYSLKYAATGGQPRGSHGGLWHDLGTHTTPASAAKAAREHYERSFD
jgi:hypothetical protein